MTKAEKIWAGLSPSQKAALCCIGGVPIPLWTHLNYTVMSVRALVRRGLLDGIPVKLTPLGRRVLRCVPECPTIPEQLQALQELM